MSATEPCCTPPKSQPAALASAASAAAASASSAAQASRSAVAASRAAANERMAPSLCASTEPPMSLCSAQEQSKASEKHAARLGSYNAKQVRAGMQVHGVLVTYLPHGNKARVARSRLRCLAGALARRRQLRPHSRQLALHGLRLRCPFLKRRIELSRFCIR